LRPGKTNWSKYGRGVHVCQCAKCIEAQPWRAELQKAKKKQPAEEQAK